MYKIKSFFIILLTAFCLNVKSQQIIASSEIDPLEVILIHRAAKIYLKDTNVQIIIKNSPLYPGLEGMTQQIGPKLYSIDIAFDLKNKKERKWTILHEFGHVLDFHLGFLSQHPPRWMGKRIDSRLPWNLRPWEISADNWAAELWAALLNEPPPYVIWNIEN